MTTKGFKSATQISIGSEDSPGDGATPTRRIVTKTATYREVEEQEMFEQAMHGTLSRAVLAPVTTRTRTELELPLEFTFEQALIPLLAGFDGSVTPTTPGTGDARLWTFTSDPEVLTDPMTLSLEWVESNFAASPTDVARSAAYAFCTGFNLRVPDNGLPTLNVSLVARGSEETTKTTVALPDDLHFVPSARTSLYIDESWSGLGGSQIVGQVYNIDYTFSGYLRPGYYLDGRATPDLTCHDFGPRMADLKFDMVLDPTMAYADEAAAKVARDLRFVRVQIDGPDFAAPDDALAHFFKIDGAYYHAPDSLAERGRDRDGHAIVSVHLLSAYDDTAGNDIQFILQNAIADLFDGGS
jgi:hypothetical protein